MGLFNRPFHDLNRCFPLHRGAYGDPHDHDHHHGHDDHGGHGDHGDHGVCRVSCACGVPSGVLHGRRGGRCRSHLLHAPSPPPPSPGLFPSEGFQVIDMPLCVFLSR